MFKFQQCLELRDAVCNLFYFIKLAKTRVLDDQEYVQCQILLKRMEAVINTEPGTLERIWLWWKRR